MEEEEKDLEIECKDCGVPFEFTVGEQEYYRQNGLYPPKRCGMCRMKKRQRYQEQE